MAPPDEEGTQQALVHPLADRGDAHAQRFGQLLDGVVVLDEAGALVADDPADLIPQALVVGL